MGRCKLWSFNIGKNYSPYKFIKDFSNESNEHGC